MALNQFAYGAGNFCMELDGNFAGFIKKVDMGSLKGDVVVHNLGGFQHQIKHVAKMSHAPIKFDIGVAMGNGVYQWIKSSFNNQQVLKSGAIMICDQDYNVVRRIDWTDGHITGITLPKLSGDGKEGLYFSVEFQPTTVRHSKGTGKANVKVGDKQKIMQNNMFRMLSPLGDTKSLISVNECKWTQKTQPVAYGEPIEDTHAPTSIEVGDLTMTLSNHVYAEWEAKAYNWFVLGNRSAALEVANTLQILAPDGKKIVAEVTYKGCGLKEVKSAALEANKGAISTFDVTCYVEELELNILEFNS